jgi:hypothetical protein
VSEIKLVFLIPPQRPSLNIAPTDLPPVVGDDEKATEGTWP